MTTSEEVRSDSVSKWAERFRRRLLPDLTAEQAAEALAASLARQNPSADVLADQTETAAERIDPATGFYYGDLGPQPGATNEEVRHVLLFLSAAEWRPAPVLPEMGQEAVERALAIAIHRAQIHAYHSKKRKMIVYRLRRDYTYAPPTT